jgi:3-oxoacyl-[acyl-carrier-protein] synthase III
LITPRLESVASALPTPQWSTTELLTAARGHLSERLEDMLVGLGVEKRHSILSNYPHVLFDGAEPKLDISATELAVEAARKCLASADVPPSSIGLVLGVTSSPGRLLPSLVCDVMAQMPELPRTVPTLSLAYMGCSAMAKVVDTARWFLSCNPGQRILVCFMEAITPLSPELPGFYSHFSEVEPVDRQLTVNAMHGFLFADAAVAMVLSAEGTGPRFGPVAHLTNDLAEDAELGTVPDGGSDVPLVQGRRLYTLNPAVTPRGTFYASQTVRTLLGSSDCGLSDLSEASAVLMHTGSRRILDGLCDMFGIATNSAAVASSYRVLREYGNTLGCSVPLMFNDPQLRPAGEGVVVAFGLSFSCGAFSVKFPSGGWSPAPTCS